MRYLTTALDLAGAALIVYGVSLVYFPALYILAGVGLLMASYRLAGDR